MSTALKIAAPPPLVLTPLSGADRGRLTEANRDRLDRWQWAFSQWGEITGTVRERVTAIGKLAGSNYATARRYYDRLRKAGGDCHVLADWRREKERASSGHKCEAFIEHCKALASARNRKAKGAWLELLKQWQNREPIPGYEGHPGWPKLPAGWSQRQFYRWAKLTVREQKSVRQGLTAARLHQPLTYTTRRYLIPGQFYMVDDMWHDHMVTDLALGRAGRPLEFHTLDLASACKIAWGWRTRVKNEDGAYAGLAGRDVRLHFAQIFSQCGYLKDHPAGTTLLLECGTAAMSEALERTLYDATGGQIKVERNGMSGEPALIGQYGGRPKGDFKFKAALESLGNLIHNRMDALPGQTGLSRDRRPEELHGMLRENDALLSAFRRLSISRPDVAALIQFPLLTATQFGQVAAAIYQEINSRTDHALEGWDDHYVSEFRFTPESPWLPADQLMALAPAQQELALQVIETMPGCSRPRKKSPLEVWQPGRAALTPLDPALIWAIIGEDLAKDRTVIDHKFSVEDKELGPGKHIYEARVADCWGRQTWLPDREKFATLINPFDARLMLVADAKGRIVGTCPRIERNTRDDIEATSEQWKRVARTERELAEPANARRLPAVAAQIARAEHNIHLLRDAEVKPARAAHRAAAAALVIPDEAAESEIPTAVDPAPSDPLSVLAGHDSPDIDDDLGAL